MKNWIAIALIALLATGCEPKRPNSAEVYKVKMTNSGCYAKIRFEALDIDNEIDDQWIYSEYWVKCPCNTVVGSQAAIKFEQSIESEVARP